MQFKDILYKLRKERKVSQQEIGNLVGVTYQAVGKWESGDSEPDNEAIIKIANYFGVSTDYLLGNISGICEEDEIEILRQLLVKNGYMKPGEDLSKSEMDNIIKMLKNNKDFLKGCK